MNTDFYEARNSHYCYENSNVLINKLDIKDNEILGQAENKIVLAKLFELRQNKKIGSFDITHFVNIHKFLFEDIYPFAGKFRTENIAKGFFSFAEWEYIEDELKKLLEKIKNDNYLANLSKEDLAKKLAYYLSELNVLHPFREGNGRTIREFIRELAYKNNYLLDLQQTEAEEMLEASMKSVIDTKELEEIILKCLRRKEKDS